MITYIPTAKCNQFVHDSVKQAVSLQTIPCVLDIVPSVENEGIVNSMKNYCEERLKSECEARNIIAEKCKSNTDKYCLMIDSDVVLLHENVVEQVKFIAETADDIGAVFFKGVFHGDLGAGLWKVDCLKQIIFSYIIGDDTCKIATDQIEQLGYCWYDLGIGFIKEVH